MPIVPLNIPDTTQNIDKPIVLSVLKDLIRLRVLPKSKKTHYHEVIKSAKVPGRDNAGQITDPHPHRRKLLGDDVLIVEVEREASEYPGMAIKTMYHEGTPYIHDAKLGVKMTPIYDSIKYVVNFLYTSSSRNKIQNIRDNIRQLLFSGNELNIHTINYSMALPREAVLLMEQMYTLREGFAGYGDTVDTYIKSVANHNMVTAADGSGTALELRFTEEQRGVEGYYDTAEYLDLVDNEDSTYSIEMGYYFTVNKPIMIRTKYPLVVHNNLLPREWVAVPKEENRIGTHSLDPATEMGLDNNEKTVEPDVTTYPIINPSIDDVRITHKINGMFPIVQSLCLIGDDKRSLLNLVELGENLIYENLGKYLRDTGKDHVTDRFKSLFHVRLYVNGEVRHMDRLEVSNDLIVKATKELNYRDTHHVVIYSVYDFDHLSDDALGRLIQHPKLMRSIAFSAWHSDLISDFVYKAIMGTYILYEGKRVWLDGIRTVRGYRLLQRVLLDTLPPVKTVPHAESDLFDTIYQTDKLGTSNELYQRTVQVTHTTASRKEQ